MPAKRSRKKSTHRLTPAQVRAIFMGSDSAEVAAKRFRVSPTLVYLIRSRRVHRTKTEGLRGPRRVRRRSSRASTTAAQIDVDKLAEAIVKRLVRILRGR